LSRGNTTLIVVSLTTVLLGLAASGAVLADGTTHYVSPGQDIQGIIDAASPGDTIQFASGTYALASALSVSKPLTLTSADPYADEKPLLDGGGSLGTIVYINSDGVVIDGLEIANGTADLVLQSGAYAGTVIRNCIVHDSTGDEGIQLKQCTDCVVEFNLVYDVAQDGISVADGSHGCLISNNEIYNSYSENAVIYVYDSYDITVESNYIHDTQAANGITFYKNYGTTHTITNNLIVRNRWHGGKHCYDEADGNAVSIYKPRVSSTYVVTHNTIDDNAPANSCAQPGNAIYANDGSGVGFVTNAQSNIVTNHSGYGIRTYYGASVGYSCNDLWQNALGATDGHPADNGGNISADPLFDADYSLREGSPAIGMACDGGDMGVDFSQWGHDPALHITKAVDPPAVEVGAGATFTITVSNDGPGTARGVVLTDEIDTDLQICSVETTQGTPLQVGQMITVELGTLERDETVTVTIAVTTTEMGTQVNIAGLCSLRVEAMDSNSVPLEVGPPAQPAPDLYFPLVLCARSDG
jgi:uncharacterized repeat protein (TIGR01451 family)